MSTFLLFTDCRLTLCEDAFLYDVQSYVCTNEIILSDLL